MPDKVLIPERYLDIETSTPLSPEELREKQKKVERIKTLIAKSKYDAHHILIHCTLSNRYFVFVSSVQTHLLLCHKPYAPLAEQLGTAKVLKSSQALKIQVQKDHN